MAANKLYIMVTNTAKMHNNRLKRKFSIVFAQKQYFDKYIYISLNINMNYELCRLTVI